jgi:Uma2 family endonuclease
MTASAPARPAIKNLADLLERLGGVPLARIRFHPAPGTATEADVLASSDGEDRLCELVDGVLVDKAMGYYKSWVAVLLSRYLLTSIEQHDLGILLGADGALRLASGLVRIPDVAFIAWERFPNRELPAEPIPSLAPDLAVEVLSPSNTAAEMERKLNEYFAAGAQLVWYADPDRRTVRVYTTPADSHLLSEDDTLDGGTVLPGFQLSLREWFDRAGRRREA